MSCSCVVCFLFAQFQLEAACPYFWVTGAQRLCWWQGKRWALKVEIKAGDPTPNWMPCVGSIDLVSGWAGGPEGKLAGASSSLGGTRYAPRFSDGDGGLAERCHCCRWSKAEGPGLWLAGSWRAASAARCDGCCELQVTECEQMQCKHTSTVGKGRGGGSRDRWVDGCD